MNESGEELIEKEKRKKRNENILFELISSAIHIIP